MPLKKIIGILYIISSMILGWFSKINSENAHYFGSPPGLQENND